MSAALMIREHGVRGHGIVGDVAAGAEAHRFERCSRCFLRAAGVEAGFSVEEQDVGEADDAVVGVSIGVGVPKWRLLSSVVEVLLGVVEVGQTRWRRL